MSEVRGANLLILDFCADQPLLALAAGEEVKRTEILQERSAAAEWLPAVKRMLKAQHWHLRDLDAIGVVGGPGAFTGVRTGVAAAKGLCEAASLKLTVVSRLAVLALASRDTNAVAVLYAGRDQVYCRVPAGPHEPAAEKLASVQELESMVNKRLIVIAEPRLLSSLAAFQLRLVTLGVEQILPIVQEALRGGGNEILQADANYVRSESQIYHRPAISQT